MNKNIERIFEDNWDEIKSGLKSIWNLTPGDFKQIEGSYDIFIGKIKKAYGETKEEINEKLLDFFDTEEITHVKNKLHNKKEKIEEEVTSVKGLIENCVEQYLQTIKEKTLHFEDNVIQYARDNPIKILGLAALASYTLSKVFYPSK